MSCDLLWLRLPLLGGPGQPRNVSITQGIVHMASRSTDTQGLVLRCMTMIANSTAISKFVFRRRLTKFLACLPAFILQSVLQKNITLKSRQHASHAEYPRVTATLVRPADARLYAGVITITRTRSIWPQVKSFVPKSAVFAFEEIDSGDT